MQTSQRRGLREFRVLKEVRCPQESITLSLVSQSCLSEFILMLHILGGMMIQVEYLCVLSPLHLTFPFQS